MNLYLPSHFLPRLRKPDGSGPTPLRARHPLSNAAPQVDAGNRRSPGLLGYAAVFVSALACIGAAAAIGGNLAYLVMGM